jgi:site-specific DNA-methyltransferase (adenine-specific)
MNKTKLMLGDNIESLKKLPDNSVDSVVSDPPYGLSFMNKKWDYDVPSVEFWKEVYRVLKPGGYVLSFGGTRTYHRMVVNIEDAGFEIRDQIQWIYGSGFPKSLNIGKAVDKLNGLEIPKNTMRVVNSVGIDNYDGTGSGRRYDSVDYDAKNEYNGWGTALKPAMQDSSGRLAKRGSWQKFAKCDWLFEASVQSRALQIQTEPNPNWRLQLVRNVVKL